MQGNIHTQELLQDRGAGFKKQMLEKFLAQLDLCIEWFREVGRKREKQRERIGFHSPGPVSKKNGHKLFQSSPRDSWKLGDVLLPLWLLVELSLVLVKSRSLWDTKISSLSVYCLSLVHQSVHVCLVLFRCLNDYSMFHIEKKSAGCPSLDLVQLVQKAVSICKAETEK